MKKIYNSANVITWLRATYPGRWEYRGGGAHSVWCGEDFTVTKKDGALIRTDTGKRVNLLPKQKRSHFIHTILQEKFGGDWVRDPDKPEWASKDHDFRVHRTSQWERERGRSKIVYARTDNGDVVYRSDKKVRFYREEGE